MPVILFFLAIIAISTIAIFGLYILIKILQIFFPHLLQGEGLSALPRRLSASIAFKFVLVGVLIIIMILPLEGMRSTVVERGERYERVLADIADTWGGEQVLHGPMLVIPFEETTTELQSLAPELSDENARIVSNQQTKTKHAILLPESLAIDMLIEPATRERGLYEALVYRGTLALSGQFSLDDISDAFPDLEPSDFDNAYLAIGLSDTQAINQIQTLNWNEDTLAFASGLNAPIVFEIPSSDESDQLLDAAALASSATNESLSQRSIEDASSGFHASLPRIEPNTDYAFETTLLLNGSEGFRFAPFGRATEVNIRSSWPHPSFQGDVLPNQRDVSEAGFQATWNLPSIARNYSQRFVYEDQTVRLNELLTGVDLVEPVHLYSKIERAVKYGLLFTLLTFLTFLIFELGFARVKMHIVQYALIGGALVLFYLCLLSLSEHQSFAIAYLISSAAIISLISLYALAATRSGVGTLVMSLMMTALYAVLYAMINEEDYAILMGSGLLLLTLSVLMFLTRRFNQPTYRPLDSV